MMQTMDTLPETNIAPKNGWLEYYFPCWEGLFLGSSCEFQGGYALKDDPLTHS